MLFQEPQLALNRCPHCSVDTPNLYKLNEFDTANHDKSNMRTWAIYKCNRCGGVVTTSAQKQDVHKEIVELYPSPIMVHHSIPKKASKFLSQAIDTIKAPSGSVMLCASAIDAMLKEKGYVEGSLNSRIIKASKDHVITSSMSDWAHEVRLVANDERHADEFAELASEIDAKKAVDFAMALAEFLFVLPSKVQKGIEEAKLN